MRQARAGLAALLVCTLLPAATNAVPPNPLDPSDTCGDPMMVSDSYEAHWGKVGEGLDPVTVVIEGVPDRPAAGHTPGAARRGPFRGVRDTLRLGQPEPPPSSSPLWEKARRGLERRTLGRVVHYAMSHWQETRGVTNVLLDFAASEDERLLR